MFLDISWFGLEINLKKTILAFDLPDIFYVIFKELSWEFLNHEKSRKTFFSEKILHQIKKVKETDPPHPQNHRKT